MKRTKHIYKRFVSLFVGQSFYLTRKKMAVKTGFCSCQEITAKPTTLRIAPWRRIRTLVPVKKLSPPTGILRAMTPEVEGVPYVKDHYYAPQVTATTGCAMPNEGKTHYVGDDCPGGHKELCGPIGYPGIEKPDDRDVTGKLLRDPMVQDHTPQPQPEHDRAL